MTGMRTLHQNRYSLPSYAVRDRYQMPISTATTESTVNQVISRRMVKRQQMRWSRDGAHRVLEVRTQVLNGTLEGTFQRWYPGFRTARAQQRAVPVVGRKPRSAAARARWPADPCRGRRRSPARPSRI